MVAVKALYVKIKITFELAMILEISGKEIVEKIPSRPPKSIMGLITEVENLSGTLQNAEHLGDVE